MDALTRPLAELSEFSELVEAVHKKKLPVLVTGCAEAEKSNFIRALSEAAGKKNKVIITFDEARAREIVSDMKLYDRNTLLYPAKDIMFFAADVHGNAIVSERLQVLKRIAEGGENTFVLSIEAGLTQVLPLALVLDGILRVRTAETLDTDKLKRVLTELGYEHVSRVTGKGEFSVRGGIIDIYPMTEESPYRIELWGDEVDTVRSFDPESQRSIERVEEVTIYPASETVLSEKRKAEGIKKIEKERDRQVKKLRELMRTEEAARLDTAVREWKEGLEVYGGSFGIESFLGFFFEETESFFDYFGEDTIFFIDEPTRVEEKAKAVAFEWRDTMSTRLEKGYILPKQAEGIFDPKKIFAALSTKNLILLSLLEHRTGGMESRRNFQIGARSLSPYNGSFDLLLKDLLRFKAEKYRVLLLTASGTRAERLAEDLRDAGLNAVFSEDRSREVKEGETVIFKGNLRQGFEYPLIRFAVISESDIFGKEKKRKKKKKGTADGTSVMNFSELHEGDYVIHDRYGIGIYRGIEKITTDGITKDYVKIEYGGGSSLFVPATGLDMLQKYGGKDGAKPKIHTIGGKEWTNTKARVKASIAEIAKDLVELYARRSKEEGHRFGEDTVWQREFEEMFPYEETEDQLAAIEDVKRDMESGKIMDRLICGDVGFGKTEVAIRAAFKAVTDGKQAVLLVPTTILAGQHYSTFVQRMKSFPLSVDVLSRFRTAKEVKEIKEKLSDGRIDIIIGTHKVLASDIRFKDLGLLIIDEEQRFGVAHKEKIKKLRENVDVLTLSATPIPRTLHMSLSGIRDMSVLEEAPAYRLPIQTYVLEHDDEIIREAIRREVTRGGQVYYVYNRVNGIEDVADRVAKMLPDVGVSYAHGRMSERELERIMTDFINGEIEVLISTTIIETGLDISNVNTILIDDADKMGLSQLYQLRGRVGRSTRTSYAFLMYKKDKMLKEVAEKRLAAIKEFTDLGSGFKISMRDLEIRGAGNLLGKVQSGHMEAVGYDLYCKLLNDAVLKLKGEKTGEYDFETKVDINMDAHIPVTYIRNEVQRLEMYKRIAGVTGEEELADLKDELVDRYGELPDTVNWLMEISYIRFLAHRGFVSMLTERDGEVKLFMAEHAKLLTGNLPALMERYSGRMKLTVGKRNVFHYKGALSDRGKNKRKMAEARLLSVKMMLKEFLSALVYGEAEEKEEENGRRT